MSGASTGRPFFRRAFLPCELYVTVDLVFFGRKEPAFEFVQCMNRCLEMALSRFSNNRLPVPVCSAWSKHSSGVHVEPLFKGLYECDVKF